MFLFFFIVSFSSEQARNEVVGRSGSGRTNQISRQPGPTISLTPQRVEKMPAKKKRVPGSEFRVQGSGFRVQGSEFRVQSSEFRVQSSEFRTGKLKLEL
ncbi:MAG: hypothetical protein DMF60_11215 [Acidobacteria bacterium]|nr:MAG: hypothetical protein DMF60_11215 [Acidobacteriota bacterium]